MGGISFTGLVVVMAIAFAVPLALGLVRRAHLSAAAVELALGVAIGPQGLGWVEIDASIAVLATMGLAFLLFLAGAEVDLAHLKGATVRLAALAFVLSVALAMALGLALQLALAGLVAGGAFVAVMLCGTHLGGVVSTLGDAGRLRTDLGRLTIAGAAIANVATVTLLGLLFGGRAAGAGARAVLLVGFVALLALVVLGVCGLERWTSLSELLLRLQDTSAQIRVRGAVLLLVALLALGGRLGVEVVLGAFAAGAVLSLVDRDAARTHPLLRVKLEGIGYGLLVPVFMVAAGMRLDVDALTADAPSLALAPILLAGLVVVRGLPALLLYRGRLGARGAAAAGLLQATSLPFIVAASQIAVSLGAIGPGAGAALVAAGLVSVAVLPEVAKTLLRGAPSPGDQASTDGGARGSPR